MGWGPATTRGIDPSPSRFTESKTWIGVDFYVLIQGQWQITVKLVFARAVVPPPEHFLSTPSLSASSLGGSLGHKGRRGAGDLPLTLVLTGRYMLKESHTAPNCHVVPRVQIAAGQSGGPLLLPQKRAWLAALSPLRTSALPPCRN